MHISTEETIAATIAARTAYFESVQEKPLPKDYLTEIVAPENIKIGDYMLQYGCVYKVTEIQDQLAARITEQITPTQASGKPSGW